MIDGDYIKACEELNKEYSRGQINVDELRQINWEEENTYTVTYKGVSIKLLKSSAS